LTNIINKTILFRNSRWFWRDWNRRNRSLSMIIIKNAQLGNIQARHDMFTLLPTCLRLKLLPQFIMLLNNMFFFSLKNYTVLFQFIWRFFSWALTFLTHVFYLLYWLTFYYSLVCILELYDRRIFIKFKFFLLLWALGWYIYFLNSVILFLLIFLIFCHILRFYQYI
jgi:hypothetical protein